MEDLNRRRFGLPNLELPDRTDLAAAAQAIGLADNQLPSLFSPAATSRERLQLKSLPILSNLECNRFLSSFAVKR
jgi:hypothetical protein